MSFINCKIVAVEPEPEIYFAQPVERGHKDYHVSSSMLREFLRCPARWRAGYEPPDSVSKHFGSLLDTLLLTPKQFDGRYVERPETYTNDKGETKPWHHASKTCQAWASQHEKQIILPHEEINQVQKAVARAREDDIINDFVNESDKQVWVTGQWRDKETGLVVPVKCLIDLVPRKTSEFFKSIGDLKTARNAAAVSWQRHVFEMGYHIQAAFNLDMYRAAMPNEDRCNFCFICVENYPPWQTGRRILGEDFLTLGRTNYTKALEIYCQCLRDNFWPGYDDTDESSGGWSITNPSPWMETEMLFAPCFDFKEPETRQAEDENNDLIP